MLSMHGIADHHGWLAALETIGAVMLIMPRVRKIGLVILLLVFVGATVIILRAGHLPIYLVLYAGTALFIYQLSGTRVVSPKR
jgi:hypothetical protein